MKTKIFTILLLVMAVGFFSCTKEKQTQFSLKINVQGKGDVIGEKDIVSEKNFYARLKANETSPEYVFRAWIENNQVLSTKKDTLIYVNSNRIIDAVFGNTFKINLSANNPECQVNGGGEFEYGQEITVKAIAPNDKWSFLRWTVDGNEISKNSEYSFKVVKDIDLVAEFFNEQKGFKVYSVINDENGGTVSKEQFVKRGESVEVVATANNGWFFYTWKNSDGAVLTHENNCIIENVQTDIKLTATFIKESDITPPTFKDRNEYVYINKSDLYDGYGLFHYEDVITLKAKNKELHGGNVFARWFGLDDIIEYKKSLEDRIPVEKKMTIVGGGLNSDYFSFKPGFIEFGTYITPRDADTEVPKIDIIPAYGEPGGGLIELKFIDEEQYDGFTIKLTNGNCFKEGSWVEIEVSDPNGFKGKSLRIENTKIFTLDNNIQGTTYKSRFQILSVDTKKINECTTYASAIK